VAAPLVEAEAEAMGVVDAENAVDAVDTVGAVDPETATQVSAPIVNIDSHTTDAWRKRKRAQEEGNNDECISFECRLPVHVKVDCISYKHKKERWKLKIATTTAALATTGDCNPF